MTKRSMLLLCLLTCFMTSSLWALTGEQAEDLYRQGQDALNSGRYDAALESFGRLVDESPDKADRALYWQAYALNKVGRKGDALQTLRRVISDYPKSAWRDDAEALQIDIEGVRNGVRVENADDDLKLYALDALHQVEPEKAVDLLEKFLAGSHSLELKEHALFILAQTQGDRASGLLVELAQGKREPGLQVHAVRALGMVGDEASKETLMALYKSSSDRELKRTVIEGMVVGSSTSELAELIRSEKDPELVDSGLETLGAMGAGAELKEFLRTLPKEHTPAALRGLGIAEEVDAVLAFLKTSKDETTIEAALDALAIMSGGDNGTRITAALDELYRSTASKGVKSHILMALMVQNDGETLLRIFRSEKDPELKGEALRSLSMVDSPETQKLLEELLEG